MLSSNPESPSHLVVDVVLSFRLVEEASHDDASHLQDEGDQMAGPLFSII